MFVAQARLGESRALLCCWQTKVPPPDLVLPCDLTESNRALPLFLKTESCPKSISCVSHQAGCHLGYVPACHPKSQASPTATASSCPSEEVWAPQRRLCLKEGANLCGKMSTQSHCPALAGAMLPTHCATHCEEEQEGEGSSWQSEPLCVTEVCHSFFSSHLPCITSMSL